LHVCWNALLLESHSWFTSSSFCVIII
jgi:hypothetical protein